MAVHCPACGNLSQDPEFCDHCNADLNPPPAHRPPTVCPLLGQAVELSEDQRQRLARPDGCILLRTPEGWRRVHWLPRELDSVRRTPLKHRLALDTWVLPPGRLLEQDDGAWAIFEATCDWVVTWTMPAPEPMEDLARLLGYLRSLTEALDELHRQHTVWLTFDPVEIERNAQGRFRITNLDLRVFAFQQCPDQLAVKASFAAPEITRFHPNDVGPRTDVFHTALAAYYWLARLMPDGVPGLGLDAFQFELPPLRVYQPALPEGIEAVVRQGLAIEAGQRFTSPAGFVAALDEAVERARRRRAWSGVVRWELGSHTRAGRTKAALQKGNEDQVLVREYPEPARALVAVADGISTCDVGSGQLASLITTIVLDNAFDGHASAADFPAKITHLCRQGTQTLLDWAMEKGYADQLVQGSDLMGTTLTVGWLEGRDLVLGNLGDSRGYLVDGPLVEQLTVDGDLGSFLLAHGAPPEQLHELGMMSRALRECIGGCTVTPAGRVEVLDDSCIPTITRWPLLPGDILVLCSDGLVEPGAFLDDANLGDLVSANRHLGAQEIADVLVVAADALQRLPSFLEPEGFGDNISCVVIKILEE